MRQQKKLASLLSYHTVTALGKGWLQTHSKKSKRGDYIKRQYLHIFPMVRKSIAQTLCWNLQDLEITLIKSKIDHRSWRTGMRLKVDSHFLSHEHTYTHAKVLVETQTSEEASYCTKQQWWKIRSKLKTNKPLSSSQTTAVKIPKHNMSVK